MPLYHLYVSYHIYHDTPTSEIYTLSLHDALPIFAQEVRYQLDARPGEVLYWVTDMGWIMGPLEMVGGHANGAAVFMYEDRKSTRLNSSHGYISYAVFCLKKKKNQKIALRGIERHQ